MFGDDVRGWNLSFKKVHDHFTDVVDLIFVGMQQHFLSSITVAFFQNGTDERKMTLKSFHAVFTVDVVVVVVVTFGKRRVPWFFL